MPEEEKNANNINQNGEMTENEDSEDVLKPTRSPEEIYNRRIRLDTVKKAILAFLHRVGESKRERITQKLRDLKIAENPYAVFRGGSSQQILFTPTNEEVTYCLNFLKSKKNLLLFDEDRKVWIYHDMQEPQKKKATLEDYLK